MTVAGVGDVDGIAHVDVIVNVGVDVLELRLAEYGISKRRG